MKLTGQLKSKYVLRRFAIYKPNEIRLYKLASCHRYKLLWKHFPAVVLSRDVCGGHQRDGEDADQDGGGDYSVLVHPRTLPLYKHIQITHVAFTKTTLFAWKQIFFFSNFFSDQESRHTLLREKTNIKKIDIWVQSSNIQFEHIASNSY